MKIDLSSVFKNILIVAILLLSSSISTFATTLPPYVLETIKTNFPDAVIRFDGLITLKDGTTYIPILPTDTKKDPSGNIVSTYPSGKKFLQRPEVVLFDSNYALLKVIRDKNGNPTVTDSKKIPFVIKTGLFPQDLLVPPGFYIPDDMKIMLGDLDINVVHANVNATIKGLVRINGADSKIVPVPHLSGKTLLATTLDSKQIYFIPADSSTPLFSLELQNLPKFIQPVNDDKYILVAVAGKTYIDVADVQQEVFAKKIDLGYQPTEIILNSDKTKAFVAVEDDQALFVIDLKTMSLFEKIKIKGYPKNIALTADDKQLVYQDKNSGDIYTLTLDATYLNKYVYNASNVSKFVLDKNYLYILSRTENILMVVDTNIRDLIYKQPVSQKPVDMILIDNKLYILSALNQLDIFDLNDFAFKQSIKLSDNGFSRKIVSVPNTNVFMITNVLDKNYTVFDPVTDSIVKTVKTTVYINDLKVMNRGIK